MGSAAVAAAASAMGLSIRLTSLAAAFLYKKRSSGGDPEEDFCSLSPLDKSVSLSFTERPLCQML